jgi:outer membrane immunogenic protein
MRGVVAGLAMLGLVQSAVGADLDGYLRGSISPTYHWGGVYGGAQVGYSSASVNFGESVDRLVNFILFSPTFGSGTGGNFPFLGQSSTSGASFGGFVGYNAEWESVTLGVEFNYNRYAAMTVEQSSCCFLVVGNIPVEGKASLNLTDLATFRARAGWEIGQFLPYGFGGLAVSRQDVMLNANRPGTTANLTVTQNGEFAYGFTAGLGVDAALWSSLFVRGEWEFTRVSLITAASTATGAAATNGITLNMNTFRAALGVKF